MCSARRNGGSVAFAYDRTMTDQPVRNPYAKEKQEQERRRQEAQQPQPQPDPLNVENLWLHAQQRPLHDEGEDSTYFFRTRPSSVVVEFQGKNPGDPMIGDAHPLRGLVRLLWHTVKQNDSQVIRMYGYSLTDDLVRQLLVFVARKYRGTSFRIFISSEFGASTEIFFRRRNCSNISLKVATDGDHRTWYKRTKMHRKSVITEGYVATGSYNLSYAARYQNAEELYLVRKNTAKEINEFDAIWERGM